jgi:hypothetical protein
MTVSTKKIIAYGLMPLASNHINEDLGYDVELIPFDGSENISTAMCRYPEPIEFPNPVLFQGLLSTVRQTDYPITAGEEFPLFSKRMVEVLESVGPFPHNVLPTRIIDGVVRPSLSNGDERYDSEGNLRPEYYTDNYVLLQITEYLDAMDLERSEYEEYDEELNLVVFVDKFVFKDIGREYPPIFRLTHSPVDLFISEAAKQALEAAGMRSLWLTSHGDTEFENIYWE